MGSALSDNKMRLILLSMIQLSGGHCIILIDVTHCQGIQDQFKPF